MPEGIFAGTWSDPACLSSACNHTWAMLVNLLVHKSVIGVTVHSATLL